jgi:acylphosphatase
MSPPHMGATYRIVILGKVQGVSFRVTLRERAIRHQVRGWVKNREDGAVEAMLHGREDKIREVLRWAESGPPGAIVTHILSERVNDYHPPQVGFMIIY